MYCKFCGKEIDEESRFCQYCGKTVGIDSAPDMPEKNTGSNIDPGLNPMREDNGQLAIKEELERIQGKRVKRRNPFLSFLMKIGIGIVAFFLIAWPLSGRDPISNVLYLVKTLPHMYGTINDSRNISNESISKEDFINSCEAVDSEALARYPDDYNGKNVYVSGEVFQVVDDSDVEYVLISPYDGTNNIMIRVATGVVDYEILEGDVLNIYGVGKGEATYENLSGVKVSKPLIDAKFIELE